MTPANHKSSEHSRIYVGQVRHRRHGSPSHHFRNKLFLMYLDLDEVDQLFDRRWFWSAGRPNLAWYRRADHFGPVDKPLEECVRDLVHERTGAEVTGPIRLLTHLRYFGWVMNPVSFFFCFDPSGTRVEAVVAEVTNTPWRERHCYVIHPAADAALIRARHGKEFHVSPFMPMDMEYRWTISAPGDRLNIRIENHRDGRRAFDASLNLYARPVSAANLAKVLCRYPVMTAQVGAAIYWQALRLWWKKATFHPHPRKRESSAVRVPTAASAVDSAAAEDICQVVPVEGIR